MVHKNIIYKKIEPPNLSILKTINFTLFRDFDVSQHNHCDFRHPTKTLIKSL